MIIVVDSPLSTLVFDWIYARSLCNLDTALSNHSIRAQWLDHLKSISSKSVDEWHHNHLRWALMRNFRLHQILVNPDECDTLSEATFEAVMIAMGDAAALTPYSLWEERKYIQKIDLLGCQDLCDTMLSVFGHGCLQLQAINLNGCQRVLYIGVSALADN